MKNTRRSIYATYLLLVIVVCFPISGLTQNIPLQPNAANGVFFDNDIEAGRIILKLNKDGATEMASAQSRMSSTGNSQFMPNTLSRYRVRTFEPLISNNAITTNQLSIARSSRLANQDSYLELRRLMRLEVDGLDIAGTKELIRQLNKDPLVEYAEPDYRVSVNAIPNDPDYSQLWAMRNIYAEAAWDTSTGSGDVIVAIIDTGVDYNHPDLSANILRNAGGEVVGYDYRNNDADPMDDQYHGTHVAGTIAAVANNNVGITGVAWNAKIMPLKFLGSSGSGYTSGAVESVQFAIEHGAHIMSNSWGGGGFSQALHDAIVAARDAGILFVAAAGNDNRDVDDQPHYPSSYDVDNVLSVASITAVDERSGFSNWGLQSVDLAAPGSFIYSTFPDNSYNTISGTSMATPHVSGVAVLLKAMHPDWSYAEIKQRLMQTASRLPALQGLLVTGGMVNAASALSTIIDTGYPELTITGVDSGHIVGRGTIAIAGNVTDDTGSATLDIAVYQPVRVGSKYRYDRVSQDTVAGSDGAWTYNIDTTVLENKITYVIVVRARDAAFNTVSKTFRMSVLNGILDETAPYISLVDPRAEQVVAHTGSVQGFVQDDIGVRKIKLDLLRVENDGETLVESYLPVFYAYNFNQSIDTQNLPDGNYRLEATAWDLADNIDKAEVSFTIDNTGDAVPEAEIVSHTLTPGNPDIMDHVVEVEVRADDADSFVTQRQRYDDIANVYGRIYRKQTDGTFIYIAQVVGQHFKNYHFTFNPIQTAYFKSDTEYRVDFIAHDRSGNESVPVPLHFIVQPSKTDNGKPSLVIDSPASYAGFEQSVPINGTASDNVNVAGVELEIYKYCASCAMLRYEQKIASVTAVGTGNWSYDYDVNQLVANQYYAIIARAYDDVGNVSKIAGRIFRSLRSDDTAPVIESFDLAEGATLSGLVALSGTISEEQDLKEVRVSVYPDNTAPVPQPLVHWYPQSITRSGNLFNWEYAFDSGLFVNGNYIVTVRVSDMAGNPATEIRRVVIQNQDTPPPDTIAPTIDIAQPLMGDEVTGQVLLQGTAADNSGLDHVELEVKNLDTSATQTFTATGTSNWQYSLDSRLLDDGSYELKAIAYDLAGNTASTVVTISINNNLDIVFYDDFEDMSADDWSGTNSTSIATPGAVGTTAALSVTPASVISKSVSYLLPDHLAFYLNIGADTSGSIDLGSNLDWVMRLVIRDAGQIDFYGATLAHCGEYQVNTWHKFELRDIDWAAATADIYQDDTLCLNGFSFHNGRSVPLQQLKILNNSTSTANIMIDQIQIEGSISPDTINPTVEFTNPVTGQVVVTPVPVDLEASDDNSVSEVVIHTYSASGRFIQQVAAISDSVVPGIWHAELTFPESGEYNLYATAYDSSNNPSAPRAMVRSLSVVTPTKPDLIVSQITLDNYQRPVITVENAGTAPIADGATTEIKLRTVVDDNILQFDLDLLALDDQGYRAVGGSSDITLQTFLCGIHNVTVLVDADNQLNELDESNNQFAWASP